MSDTAAAELRQIVAELRDEAVAIGFSRVGVAAVQPPPHHDAFRGWLAAGLAGVTGSWLERHEPLRRDPTSLLPGARSVVMLATDHPLGGGPVAEPAAAGHGRVARYARGADYHAPLRERVDRLAAWLAHRLPGARSRGVVDSAPLAERDFAWAAGLGWFGKNTMLIDPRAGSYFLLAALLTDVPLPVDAPLETDHCGTCTACLDACPTGAFPRPGVLDAARCISSLTIEDHGPMPADVRAGLGDWVFGCDVCQEVCPWNRHAPGSRDPALVGPPAAGMPDLAGLLALDEAAFRERFRGSPILRAKRRGLLRSAAVALGNRPHPPAFAALAGVLDDPEPVIRGAAAWALGRWIAAGVMPAEAGRAVAARLAREADAAVVTELRAAAAYASGSQLAVSSTSPDGSRPGPSTA